MAVHSALDNMVRVRRHTRGENLGYPVAIINEPQGIGLTMKKVHSESHYCETSENAGTLAERIMEIQFAMSNEPHAIGLIMTKVHSEPHGCETYADLIYKLKAGLAQAWA